MRYLLLSVLVVCVIGVMIPSVYGVSISDYLEGSKVGLKWVGSVIMWSDKDSYHKGDTVTIYGILSDENNRNPIKQRKLHFGIDLNDITAL